MKLVVAILAGSLAACSGPLTAGGPALVPSFSVEPYLLRDGDGVSVVWRANPAESGSEVELLADGGPVGGVSARRDGDLFHARLPSDCGGEVRGYRIPALPRDRALHLPPCPEEERVAFAFLTDTQQDVELVRRLSAQVSERADFVLHGGDVVQRGGSEEQWRRYHAASRPFARRIATATAVGNHDGYWDDEYFRFRSYFADEQVDTWYAFAAGPVDVIVLNSEDIGDEALNARQLAWLERTLNELVAAPEAHRRWTVVLTHHAPLSSSIANAWFVPIGRSRQLRAEYVPLFERYAVDLVLAGHTHVYERSRRNGVEYVVGGPAGGLMGLLGADNPDSITLAKDRTVSHFEVDGRSLEMRTHNISGEEIDRLRLRRVGDAERAAGAYRNAPIADAGAGDRWFSVSERVEPPCEAD